jgi:hypothetical protein
MATRLRKVAKEQGTYIVRYSFLDENEEPASPNALAWSLLRDGATVVNERDSVELDPDTTVTIVLSGDDLARWPDDSGERRLFLQGTYDSTLGSDLPYTDELLFSVEDLHGVAAVS